MVNYICSRCGQIFTNKQKYENHCNRKKKCKDNSELVTNLLTKELKKMSVKTQFNQLTIDITNKLTIDEKKKGGIFMTPLNIIQSSVNFIVNYIQKNNITLEHILEPSCGSCEFIKYIYYAFDKFKSVDGIEMNTKIYESLEESGIIDKYNNLNLINIDFLKYKCTKQYSLLLGNPPYFVLSKKDVDDIYYDYFEGRPNIFILFIIKSIGMLTDNGILSFVLPRSFLNCTYYNKLRKHIYENFTILDIVDCSNNSYIDTEQQTIIFTMIKTKGDNKEFCVKLHTQYLFNTKENIIKINELLVNTTTLHDMNIKLSIGTVVWNQVKDKLTDDSDKTRLIYSGDIVNNELTMTDYKNVSKKNYIEMEGINDVVLITDRGYGVGNYELKYSIVDIDNDYLLENHIICIQSTDDISKEEKINIYKHIIKSYTNTKTKEFIHIYCGNNSLNITELEYILPIYKFEN